MYSMKKKWKTILLSISESRNNPNRTILMSQVTGKMSALRRLVRYAIFYTVEMLQFPTVHLDEDVPNLYIDLKFNGIDKLQR